MDYFVSAKNTAYHHWQLELLIESFKNLNLQNSLTIALAENPNPIYADFSYNLTRHKRIFTHKNTQYNRIYSLYTALEQNLIKQPFTIIHTDTILIKNFSPNYPITFQTDPKFLPIPEINEFFMAIKNANKFEWIPLGDTICFQDVPIEFFHRILEIAEFLSRTNIPEKYAWALTLLEYTGYMRYHATFDLENTLLDHELKYIIHYKHGLPPVFNKHMFYFEPFGMGNPYEILLEHNPTPVTNFMQQIVKKCIRKDIINLNFNVPRVRVIDKI